MAQVVKRLPAMQEDLGSIPGSGRSPGEGNGNPLQYALKNSLDGGAWKATVHGVAKSRIQLSDFSFSFLVLVQWAQWARTRDSEYPAHSNQHICLTLQLTPRGGHRIIMTHTHTSSPRIQDIQFLDCLSISLTSVSMRPLTGPNLSTLVDLRTSEKSTKTK